MLTLGLIGSSLASVESFLLSFISAIPFLSNITLLESLAGISGGTQEYAGTQVIYGYAYKLLSLLGQGLS
jgi:hypothetical protein